MSPGESIDGRCPACDDTGVLVGGDDCLSCQEPVAARYDVRCPSCGRFAGPSCAACAAEEDRKAANL